MAHYIDYSAKIYNIYLKYLSKDDIYVYSIDEVFLDITNYLKYYQISAEALVTKIIKDVYNITGITATTGIGTNLFLAKVAMDITAKHTKENKDGVRIAELLEMSYRKKLWNHKPLTDFWRIGSGIAKKLEKYGMYTMGDIARCSLQNEDLLYKLFGVNAELLIDHAWGFEPCTMRDIKAYKPRAKSISSSQVLPAPYDFNKTRLIVLEMADLLALDLTSKKLVTDKLVLTIGYDTQNDNYQGRISTDHYGRKIPYHAHGTITLNHKTSSSKIITSEIIKLYEKIVNPSLLIRRVNISAINLENEENSKINYLQFDLFSDIIKQSKQLDDELKIEKEERKLQNIVLEIKEKYGKNSILKGMNLIEGSTTIERNKMIGGHHE